MSETHENESARREDKSLREDRDDVFSQANHAMYDDTLSQPTTGSDKRIQLASLGGTDLYQSPARSASPMGSGLDVDAWYKQVPQPAYADRLPSSLGPDPARQAMPQRESARWMQRQGPASQYEAQPRAYGARGAEQFPIRPPSEHGTPGGRMTGPLYPQERGDRQSYPQRRDATDAYRPQPYGTSDGGAQVYEMKGRNGAREAMVRVPNNLDPNQPLRLVIFNHGLRDDSKSSFGKFRLNEQMAAAPQNTILVSPEWMAQGSFARQGSFGAMLNDVFRQLGERNPAMRGKTMQDVSEVSIIAHSAGNRPAIHEMSASNGFRDKITNVTILAGLYSQNAVNYFNNWMSENKYALQTGRKTFYNFYDGSTDGLTRQQAQFAQQQFGQSSRVKIDTRAIGQAPSASEIERYSVIIQNANSIGHMNLPTTLIRPIKEAARHNAMTNVG